jgi:hypothetical protein
VCDYLWTDDPESDGTPLPRKPADNFEELVEKPIHDQSHASCASRKRISAKVEVFVVHTS